MSYEKLVKVIKPHWTKAVWMHGHLYRLREVKTIYNFNKSVTKHWEGQQRFKIKCHKIRILLFSDIKCDKNSVIKIKTGTLECVIKPRCSKDVKLTFVKEVHLKYYSQMTPPKNLPDVSVMIKKKEIQHIKRNKIVTKGWFVIKGSDVKINGCSTERRRWHRL